MGLALGRHRAIATLITGASQALSLLGVAVLGVLIASEFGSDARTDGFFFANSVYAIVLFIGQSLRTTSVAALVEDPRRNAPDLVGAIGWLTLLAGVAFLVLGALVVPAATDDLPGEARVTAQESLAILWPAASLQLLSGLTAALLATRERYTLAAGAYAIGSLAAVASFVIFTPALGIDGVSVALVVGVGATFTALLVGATRSDRLPLGVPSLRGSLDRARQLLLGSAALVSAQLVVTSSVVFAASVEEGAATTYSYAVMAISALLAGAVTPVSVVFAPVVAREWDRTPEALGRSAIGAFRFGALLTAPLVAGLLFVAPAPAAQLLTALDEATLNEVFLLAFILSPALLTTLAATIPQLGVLARERFGALAIVSLGFVAFHVTASGAVIGLGGGLAALAGVASATSILLAAATLGLALGLHAWTVGKALLVAVVQIVVPGIVAYGAAAAAASPNGALLPGVTAWVCGTVAYSVWLLLRRRSELVSLLAAIRRTDP